jgi:hypothetical protein
MQRPLVSGEFMVVVSGILAALAVQAWYGATQNGLATPTRYLHSADESLRQLLRGHISL